MPREDAGKTADVIFEAMEDLPQSSRQESWQKPWNGNDMLRQTWHADMRQPLSREFQSKRSRDSELKDTMDKFSDERDDDQGRAEEDYNEGFGDVLHRAPSVSCAYSTLPSFSGSVYN